LTATWKRMASRAKGQKKTGFCRTNNALTLLKSTKWELILCDLNFNFPFMLIKPVLSDHLSCVTQFQCSLGKSHKTGFTVFLIIFIFFTSWQKKTGFCRTNNALTLLKSTKWVFLKWRSMALLAHYGSQSSCWY
jgi:hypothetical protein